MPNATLMYPFAWRTLLRRVARVSRIGSETADSRPGEWVGGIQSHGMYYRFLSPAPDIRSISDERQQNVKRGIHYCIGVVVDSWLVIGQLGFFFLWVLPTGLGGGSDVFQNLG